MTVIGELDVHATKVDSPARLVGVSKRYVIGGHTVTALENVNLEVRRGELVVILGPSGSGKTTLLNLIGVLDAPTEGSLFVAGVDVAQASGRERFRIRRRSVSFIFQSFNLFPGLTAVENVEFGADVAGREAPRSIAVEMLAKVGLPDRLHHFPHQLSGGEQQRVAIARALATGNPILLADEPTGELDFTTGIQILALLAAQRDEGRSVLIVTHNREIAKIADRIVELSSGHITSDRPPPGGPIAVHEVRW